MSTLQKQIARKMMIGNTRAKGYKFTSEQKKALSIARLGIRPSLKTRKLLSESAKKRCTKEWRENISIKKKGSKVPSMRGIKNHLWKGDSVGYRALHSWVTRNKGKPNRCEHCFKLERITGKRIIQWANISRQYKRKISDWISLCVPCHKRYDKNYKNKMK
jgi:hypothetical protein